MSKSKVRYTLVFLFNEKLNKVVLIKKTRPKWQKNKYNGVGGKVDADEKISKAAQREIKEEIGYNITNPTKLIQIGKMESEKWQVHIFATTIDETAPLLQETEEGTVKWHPINTLPDDCIDNLPWLIPLCQNKLRENYIDEATIYYKSDTIHQ